MIVKKVTEIGYGVGPEVMGNSNIEDHFSENASGYTST
jgi:hypothetical protein